jgi:hypothetical protein
MSTEPCIVGTTVLETRKVFVEMVGAAMLAAAVAKLPEADRRLYSEALAVSWIPTRIVDQLTIEISRLDGRSPENLAIASARLSVERSLRTVWRMLLRVTTDEMLVTRTPTIFGRSYNCGLLVSKISRPGVADVTLRQWSEVSDLQIVAIGAGIEAALRVAGRQNLRSNWKRSLDGAHWAITWRA